MGPLTLSPSFLFQCKDEICGCLKNDKVRVQFVEGFVPFLSTSVWIWSINCSILMGRMLLISGPLIRKSLYYFCFSYDNKESRECKFALLSMVIFGTTKWLVRDLL